MVTGRCGEVAVAGRSGELVVTGRCGEVAVAGRCGELVVTGRCGWSLWRARGHWDGSTEDPSRLQWLRCFPTGRVWLGERPA